jgi:hypothetical protein
MRHFALFIASISFLVSGCQTVAPPSPGMAGVHINVVAEPKKGAPETSVSVYDVPVARDSGSGAFEHVDYSALDEIVVWVETMSAGAATEAQIAPATIAVEARKASRNLAGAASVGQQIIVHNRGLQPGNFYSVSDGNDFDLGSIPAGGQASYIVRSAGLIEIMSDSSKEPVAQVYAVPSRWVALARSGESVDFTNLPPGRYKIASWHPRLPGYETIVTLAADKVSTATIKVGVNALPKVGPR